MFSFHYSHRWKRLSIIYRLHLFFNTFENAHQMKSAFRNSWADSQQLLDYEVVRRTPQGAQKNQTRFKYFSIQSEKRDGGGR